MTLLSNEDDCFETDIDFYLFISLTHSGMSHTNM